MSVLTRAMVMGVVTALVGVLASLTPFGMELEEDFGLGWLFRLRGVRSAPSDVVVVTTDRKSADDLGVPQEPWKWPRSFHGRLVRTLTQQGATVIAFDLFFKDTGQPDDDRAFANAMRETGTVVLFEKMTTVVQDRAPPIVMMQVQPTSRLAEAAAAAKT